MGRAKDVKELQSYPDDFDIIKVTTFTTAGDVIKSGSIISVTTRDAESDLPIAQGSIGTLTSDVTLVGDDEVVLIGYLQNYVGIDILNQPTFANDLTSIIINGSGKNMSYLNGIETPMSILGFFNKIQIPITSTDMVLIAYK